MGREAEQQQSVTFAGLTPLKERFRWTPFPIACSISDSQLTRKYSTRPLSHTLNNSKQTSVPVAITYLSSLSLFFLFHPFLSISSSTPYLLFHTHPFPFIALFSHLFFSSAFSSIVIPFHHILMIPFIFSSSPSSLRLLGAAVSSPGN